MIGPEIIARAGWLRDEVRATVEALDALGRLFGGRAVGAEGATARAAVTLDGTRAPAALVPPAGRGQRHGLFRAPGGADRRAERSSRAGKPAAVTADLA